MPSGRAKFSSFFAAVAGIAVTAFTVGVAASVTSLNWSMWLVVSWAAVLALALFLWALRPWTGQHLIGHPTLSMVAGASGTAITAMALAFAFAAGKDQEAAQNKQVQLLEAQVKAIGELQIAVRDLQAVIKAAQSSASASR